MDGTMPDGRDGEAFRPDDEVLAGQNVARADVPLTDDDSPRPMPDGGRQATRLLSNPRVPANSERASAAAIGRPK